MNGRKGKSGDWTIRIILHKTGRAAEPGRRTTKEMWERKKRQSHDSPEIPDKRSETPDIPSFPSGSTRAKPLPIRQTGRQTDRR